MLKRILVISLALSTLYICSNDCHATTVDEPIGTRYSLGETLWHMGHNPERIKEFHTYLKNKKVDISTLLPRAMAPHNIPAILIEPERLPPGKLTGWTVQGNFLQSGAADAGPTVSMPLTITKSGTYRLWIRYEAWVGGSALTQFRIYDARTITSAPMVDDEIYAQSHKEAGMKWHSIMIDFEPGNYELKLSHKRRWPWHAAGPYHRRKIDFLYFTQELWAEAPPVELLEKIRKTSPSSITVPIQFNYNMTLDAEAQKQWQLWRVRPVDWEKAWDETNLFRAGLNFWQEKMAFYAKQGANDKALPDYREPRRQVVFDDRWNMLANPVRIQKQIEALSGDVSQDESNHLWYWVRPSAFKNVRGWSRSGDGLAGVYGDFNGMAEGSFAVPRADTWHVWIRFQNINYFAHWGCEVKSDEGERIFFDRNKRLYPMDSAPRHAWQKVGALTLQKPGNLNIKIFPMRYMRPSTYRKVRIMFVTTDPDWKPSAMISPAFTRAQYDARIKDAGGKSDDGYVLRANIGTHTSGQTWWPGKLTEEQKAKIQHHGRSTILAPINVVMAPNTRRAVQLCMRNATGRELTLYPQCAPLTNRTRSLKNRLKWRVVAHAPFGNSRSQWTPFCLLRRPYVKIPPWGAAQVWATIDSSRVAAGTYSSGITMMSKMAPAQRVPINVRVSTIKVAPKTPILVGGYTMPPEGDAYLRDYRKHGFNIWYRNPISKKEMNRLGMQLQTIKFIRSDRNQISAAIKRMKDLGLSYDDWMVVVKDEPSSQIASYLDIARITHEVDPKVRVSFNPGEPATEKTFEGLLPQCDIWMTYAHHLAYGPKPHQLQAKRQAIFSKPWMWYTTPCYFDKEPHALSSMFGQIRSVPAQPGNCLGTTFFALYYPFRDAWDAAYEYIKDTSVFILPSRNGPVATPTWEAMGEAVDQANLAQMIKEHPSYNEVKHKGLVASGNMDALITWLENPVSD